MIPMRPLTAPRETGASKSPPPYPVAVRPGPRRSGVEPMPRTELRQRGTRTHRVLGQRLERQQAGPEVLDADRRHLQAEPGQPPHGRALEPRAVLLGDQQADQDRVVEANGGSSAAAARTIESRPMRS